MNTILWSLVSGLAIALVLQGFLMRASYRRKAAALLARQSKFEEAANGRLEQTKRQVAKLQSDLAAARLQLRQLGKSHAVVPAAAPAREALERELDDASSRESRTPGDGFADTQPSPTSYGSLLMQ